jgi:hypothetical protein
LIQIPPTLSFFRTTTRWAGPRTSTMMSPGASTAPNSRRSVPEKPALIETTWLERSTLNGSAARADGADPRAAARPVPMTKAAASAGR